jgi:hypothetical protein
MAKKQGAAPTTHTITPERAKRLYRLVKLLSRGPRSRFDLTRALRLNVRGFYRELEVLRTYGISIALAQRQYILEDDPADAVDRLPFPDPGLTFGEARQLARGRSRAHQKLRAQIGRIEK